MYARARRRGDGGGRGGTFDDLVRREHGKLAQDDSSRLTADSARIFQADEFKSLLLQR